MDTVNLSVIIPCHNEAKNIVPLVSSLLEVFKRNSIEGEIVVVNDNSTDETASQVRDMMQRHQCIKLVERRDGRCGVGRTLKAGFEHADGDIIITMDGDLSHDPADVPRFLHEIEAGADLVIGSRYGRVGGEAHMPIFRKLTSGGYNRMAKLLFHTNLADVTTGYRAIRKSALDKLHLSSNGFAIHPEIQLKALNSHLRITQIPIVYQRRLSGSSKLQYLRVGFPYIKVLTTELYKKWLGKTMPQQHTK